MPAGWLMEWALGGRYRRDANGLPNLNKDEIPPIPPVKRPKAELKLQYYPTKIRVPIELELVFDEIKVCR